MSETLNIKKQPLFKTRMSKNTNFSFILNLKQESNATQNPLASLLLRLEVESPDKCRSALFCLVDRTLIDIPHVLSVNRNGLQEDDRQWWSQILQSGFIDHTCLHIPSSSLHEQSVYVGTWKWNKQLENTVIFGTLPKIQTLLQSFTLKLRQRGFTNDATKDADQLQSEDPAQMAPLRTV